MASQQLLEIAVKQCMDSQQPQVATGRHRGGKLQSQQPSEYHPKHHQLIDSLLNRMLKESAAEAAACKSGRAKALALSSAVSDALGPHIRKDFLL